MDINFSINVEEYEVVKTGTVISHANKDIIFHIENLTYIISFQTDKEYTKTGLRFEDDPSDASKLRIILVNYDVSTRGIVIPLRIGSLNEKGLYFQFYLSTLADSSTRIFTYTWLVK